MTSFTGPDDDPTAEFPRVVDVPPPPDHRSWLRRHRVTAGVAGGAVLAVGLGVGVGAMAAAESSGGTIAIPAQSPASAAPPTAPAAASPAAASPSGSPATGGGRGARRGRVDRAVIIGEAGSTWTLRTRDGRTVAVTITSRTKFGLRASPETAAAFHTGDQVLVIGDLGAPHPVAARVAHPRKAAASAAPVPGGSS